MARIKDEIINIDGEDIVITNPTREDAGEMLDFLKCVFGETEFLLRYPDEMNLTVEEEGDILEKRLEDEHSVLFALKVGNRIIAAANVSGNSKKKIRHIGTIGISIRKEYWGKGLGTKMFEKIIEWADEKEILRLDLQVNINNERGVALYKRFGFRIEGTIKMATKLSDGTFSDEYMMARIAE